MLVAALTNIDRFKSNLLVRQVERMNSCICNSQIKMFYESVWPCQVLNLHRHELLQAGGQHTQRPLQHLRLTLDRGLCPLVKHDWRSQQLFGLQTKWPYLWSQVFSSLKYISRLPICTFRRSCLCLQTPCFHIAFQATQQPALYRLIYTAHYNF